MKFHRLQESVPGYSAAARVSEFEIIDRNGARWRYKRSEGYRWSWGVVEGTIDTLDRDMVEVWMDSSDPEEEGECVAYFPFAAMVGDVTPNTCLNFGLRERTHG